MTEAPGAAADLLDLLHLQLAVLDAVVLLVGIEAQRMGWHVQAHAYRICGDHEVRLALTKAACLLAANFR